MKYDAIVMLGTQPDLSSWKFPQQIYDGVDVVVKLLKDDQAGYVITSGDHSIAIDNLGLKQPFKECDAIAELIIEQGIPKTKIIRENKSKDTPSNLYFIKTEILIPQKMKNLLFVVADFRIPRLKFLCQRILGPEYRVDFKQVKSEVGLSYNEPVAFKAQKAFLRPMKDGDHNWLKDKFFDDPMYTYWREHDKQKYSQN